MPTTDNTMVVWSGSPDIDQAIAFLMRHEALHSLPLGVLNSVRRGSASEVTWWMATNQSGVVGTASISGPLNIVLSKVDDLTVIDALVDFLREREVQLPGAIGPSDEVARFAERWDANSIRVVDELVYECRHLEWPESVPGSARFANERDHQLLMEWHEQFHHDADMAIQLGDFDSERVSKTIKSKLGNGGFVFWLDETGSPVSLAGFGSPTTSTMRIGPVYTPAAARGKGYGAAVTATVTQHLFDSGVPNVTLFADLANPVANRLYRKLGYREVGGFSVYRFPSAKTA